MANYHFHFLQQDRELGQRPSTAVRCHRQFHFRILPATSGISECGVSAELSVELLRS